MANRKYINSTHEDPKTYACWVNMNRRCNDPSIRDYPAYGGRGIKVCKKWKTDYNAFYLDMGNQAPGMTIERLDVNRDYEPYNCIWIPASEQVCNKRNRKRVGNKFATEIAKEKGLSRQSVYYRLEKGIDLDAPKRPDEAIHGTVSRYSSKKHNCRCAACTEAWRIYNMRRRQSR